MRNQKTALVTGANKGIGFEVARQLARQGFRVFLGARNEKAGRAAAEKLRDEGDVIFLKIDISDANSFRAGGEKFSPKGDRLHALVNNAGILLDKDKPALTTTPKFFETT